MSIALSIHLQDFIQDAALKKTHSVLEQSFTSVYQNIFSTFYFKLKGHITALLSFRKCHTGVSLVLSVINSLSSLPQYINQQHSIFSK